jgi:hypothetical protein
MKNTQITALLIAMATVIAMNASEGESTWLTRGSDRTGRGFKQVFTGNPIEGAGNVAAGTGETALGVATLGQGGRRYEDEKPQYKERRHRRKCVDCEDDNDSRFCRRCRRQAEKSGGRKFGEGLGNALSFGHVRRKQEREEAQAQKEMEMEENEDYYYEPYTNRE